MTEPRRIITFVCAALYEVGVYNRLRPGLSKLGWQMTLVTHQLSAAIKARRLGIPCELSRRPRRRQCPALPAGESAEERLGLLTSVKAREFQHAFWEALERSAETHPPQIIAQWNGQNIGGQVATLFARQRGIRTLYLELGNIEPKIFADPLGVNAAAELAQKPQLLDRYDLGDEEIAAWLEALVARRRRMQTLPQASRLLHLNGWFLIDRAARTLMRAPWPRRQSILDRLAEKWALARRKPWPIVRPERPYLFLPLQVSKDTNLVLFSDVDNEAAIEIAARRAAERGLQLVMKAHPAETNAALLSAIAVRCARDGHLATGLNTTELVLGAEEIVTINSTVGLEGLLLGKPVTVLGRSLYGRMTRRQAAALAMRRLVDFNPFGVADATVEAVEAMLALAEPDQPVQSRHMASAEAGGAK